MDATMVKPSNVKITGKLRDTETVMRSLEGVVGKVPVMVTRWLPTLLQVQFCRRATVVRWSLSLTTAILR